MPVVTEIAIFDLLRDTDLLSPDSPSTVHLEASFNILKQQKGFIQHFWGLKDEDATKLVVFIDWEDVTDHQSFGNSEAYATLGAELAKVVSFGNVPVMTHTNFTSDANVARQAPVTAFKSFMLPEDATEEQRSALEDAFLKLAQFNMTQTTCIGYACGWTLETLPHDEAPSGKACVFNAIIGWPSRKDFQELRTIPGFKEALQPVLGSSLKLRGQDMFHINLNR
ncbi:hypothetical protein LTR84_002347 [Exophiala bonariae]|uniref:ABM domain-containing protein n=1 Tax=Exophiala bonariae TaxID=1690606 RepID=A0AAV9N996_9EURO|nr:hypothetical protein LTR84_002347 [Exophiala bonariae]